MQGEKRQDKRTYTKKAVKVLLVIGVINGSLPYVLSLLGKEPVQEMGIAWVTEIVAVILGYLCKAYFETKAQRKQDLEDAKFEAEQEENNEL